MDVENGGLNEIKDIFRFLRSVCKSRYPHELVDRPVFPALGGHVMTSARPTIGGNFQWSALPLTYSSSQLSRRQDKPSFGDEL